MSKRWNGRAETHPDLVAPMRDRLAEYGRPYIIENVMGAPLVEPVRLCGSSFSLGVQRHRIFESNVPLIGLPCDHASQPLKYRIYDHGSWRLSSSAPVYGHGGGKAKECWSEAMGIDWMTREELTQAIPPAYTEFLGRQLMEYLSARQVS